VKPVARLGHESIRVLEVEHRAAERVEQIDRFVGLSQFAREPGDRCLVLAERGQVARHPLEDLEEPIGRGPVEGSEAAERHAGRGFVQAAGAARGGEFGGIKSFRRQSHGERRSDSALADLIRQGEQSASGERLNDLGLGLIRGDARGLGDEGR
jgi:hypothetical protein